MFRGIFWNNCSGMCTREFLNAPLQTSWSWMTVTISVVVSFYKFWRFTWSLLINIKFLYWAVTWTWLTLDTIWPIPGPINYYSFSFSLPLIKWLHLSIITDKVGWVLILEWSHIDIMSDKFFLQSTTHHIRIETFLSR